MWANFPSIFFLFIAVLRAQVYYLICFVMYTLQRITFKVDKKYAKNFNFGDGNFLFFVTHI